MLCVVIPDSKSLPSSSRISLPTMIVNPSVDRILATYPETSPWDLVIFNVKPKCRYNKRPSARFLAAARHDYSIGLTNPLQHIYGDCPFGEGDRPFETFAPSSVQALGPPFPADASKRPREIQPYQLPPGATLEFRERVAYDDDAFMVRACVGQTSVILKIVGCSALSLEEYHSVAIVNSTPSVCRMMNAVLRSTFSRQKAVHMPHF